MLFFTWVSFVLDSTFVRLPRLGCLQSTAVIAASLHAVFLQTQRTPKTDVANSVSSGGAGCGLGKRARPAPAESQLDEAGGGAEDAAHQDEYVLVLLEDGVQQVLKVARREQLQPSAERRLDVERARNIPMLDLTQ